jgi:tetratricopeptide (TPR) repeat protein
MEEAKQNLERAIQTSSDPERSYTEVAFVYLRNGMRAEAMDTYKSARIKMNDPSMFAMELASLYEQLFDYKQAVDEYFLFMGSDSTKFDLVEDRINKLIQTDQHLDGIESALSQRIKKNSKDKYSHKLYGDLLFRRKNLSGAFESYKIVDALFGANGEYILRYIRMCYDNKYFDQVTQASNYLLSTRPPKEAAVSAELYIARSYEGMEKFTEAIEAYQKIIEKYEESFTDPIAFSHFWIGEIHLFYLKEPEEAFSRFQQVISSYSNTQLYPVALVRRGDCLLAQGDLDSARTLFANALKDLKVAPKEEELNYKLTEIEFLEGNFEQALEGYNKVIAGFPKGLYVNNSLERIIAISDNQELDRPLLAMFADALFKNLQGKTDSAIIKLDALISAKSEKLSDLAQMEKAKIYREEKKYSQSLKVLDEFLEEYPESFLCPRAQMLKGDLYNYQLNDKTKAIQAYQKLLKDYERSVYVDEVRDKLRELKAEIAPSSSG